MFVPSRHTVVLILALGAGLVLLGLLTWQSIAAAGGVLLAIGATIIFWRVVVGIVDG